MANKIDIINIGGTSGKIEGSDGMKVDLQPPAIHDASDQLSPKHLIGMAWSACLNATLLSILTANKIDNQTRVRVEVESKKDIKNGLHYIMTAYVAVEGFDEEKTLKFAKHADRLCPISKLIAENEFVSLVYEAY